MLHDPKFWLAVSFFIFLGATIKYVFPAVIKMIDNKKDQIAAQLKAAEEMKATAQKLLNDAQKYHRESVEQSRELIARAKMESETIFDNSKKAIETELNNKMLIAQTKIKQEEEKIIRQMKTNIVSAAIKIIEEDILKGENKKLSETSVNQAISNISKLIH